MKWITLELLEHTIRKMEARYAKKTEVQTLACTFSAAGWQQSGSSWAQTASCPGMQSGADYSAPWAYAGTQAEQKAASLVTGGTLTSLDGKMKAVVLAKPQTDVQIFVRKK